MLLACWFELYNNTISFHTHTVYRYPLQHLKEDYEVIPILQITHPAQERLAPPLRSTSRALFTIADKLVPAINDNLMDENGRDQSVSVSHN